MGWNGISEAERLAWQRIVALLVSLAGLAGRASLCSRPVCWMVLWCLRPAETVAADYVADLTGIDFLHDEPLRSTDDATTQAVRLSARFYTLAAVLAAFVVGLLASFLPATTQRASAARLHRARALPPAARLFVERRDSS